jgi:hypothetical protein
MSLPSFSTQQSLFGVGSLTHHLFDPSNRYRLFAEKLWPLLAAARPQLESMYCADNGRPAVEPVVMLGVSVLQFLDRVPDRQAIATEAKNQPASARGFFSRTMNQALTP